MANQNKRSATEVLYYGYRYQLDEDWCQYYEQGGITGYYFAEPAEYVNGNIIGDCWIVNAQGKKHPGFNNVPVPHNISNLYNPIKIYE